MCLSNDSLENVPSRVADNNFTAVRHCIDIDCTDGSNLSSNHHLFLTMKHWCETSSLIRIITDRINKLPATGEHFRMIATAPAYDAVGQVLETPVLPWTLTAPARRQHDVTCPTAPHVGHDT